MIDSRTATLNVQASASKKATGQEAALSEPATQTPGRRRSRLKGLAVPLAILVLLEIVVRIGWVQSYQMPAPSEIAATLTDLADGALWKHIGASLIRVL